MADDLLLDIQLDSDDDADENRTTSTDRTHVTEEQFQRTRATYRAKIDSGNIYLTLPSALPPPAKQAGAYPFSSPEHPSPAQTDTPQRLGGKAVQLVAAAAGELYFFKHYETLLALLGWLRSAYDLPASSMKGRGLDAVLDGWEERCRARMAQRVGNGV